MPAATPLATNPSAAVTDRSRPPLRRAAARRFLEPESAVDVLDRLTGGALSEVVLGTDHDRPVGEPVLEDADLGPSVCWTRPNSGRPLRQHPHDRAARVGGLQQHPQIGARGADVAGREQAAPDGSRCGVNETGNPSSWAISARVDGPRRGRVRRFRAPSRSARSALSVRPAPVIPRSRRRRRIRLDHVSAARERGGSRSRSSRGWRSAGPPRRRARGGRRPSRQDPPVADAGTRTTPRSSRHRAGGAHPRDRRRRGRRASTRRPLVGEADDGDVGP